MTEHLPENKRKNDDSNQDEKPKKKPSLVKKFFRFSLATLLGVSGAGAAYEATQIASGPEAGIVSDAADAAQTGNELLEAQRQLEANPDFSEVFTSENMVPLGRSIRLYFDITSLLEYTRLVKSGSALDHLNMFSFDQQRSTLRVLIALHNDRIDPNYLSSVQYEFTAEELAQLEAIWSELGITSETGLIQMDDSQYSEDWYRGEELIPGTGLSASELQPILFAILQGENVSLAEGGLFQTIKTQFDLGVPIQRYHEMVASVADIAEIRQLSSLYVSQGTALGIQLEQLQSQGLLTEDTALQGLVNYLSFPYDLTATFQLPPELTDVESAQVVANYLLEGRGPQFAALTTGGEYMTWVNQLLDQVQRANNLSLELTKAIFLFLATGLALNIKVLNVGFDFLSRKGRLALKSILNSTRRRFNRRGIEISGDLGDKTDDRNRLEDSFDPDQDEVLEDEVLEDVAAARNSPQT